MSDKTTSPSGDHGAADVEDEPDVADEDRFRSLPKRIAHEDMSAAHETQPPGETVSDGDLQRNILLFGSG